METPNEAPDAANRDATVEELPRACSDETAAVEFLEKKLWGDAPKCAHCSSLNVYAMKDRKTGGRNARFLWRCYDCNKQFTVRVGTVFEDSKIALRHWCFAFWAACSSKKGVSALQIKRQTGLSYKSSLFMMHRVRYAMAAVHASPPKLSGTVEVDETYVGGKPRYHRRGKGGGFVKGYLAKKSQVVALLERGGNVRAMVHDRVTAGTLKDVVRDNVDRSATIYTDEAQRYVGLHREFAAHESVNHKRGEYVRGIVTTNGVEGFFSLIKRGLYGTFHSVSKQHLHRYVAEFEFRHNHRHESDGDRTTAAIQAAHGKRLRYREPAPRA